MKYLILALYLTSFFVTAQQIPSQRQLLDLEEFNAVKDFGFKEEPVKIVIKRDFERKSNSEGELNYKEVRFDKLYFNTENNLSKRDIKYSAFGSAKLITKKYNYNNYNLLEKVVIFNENDGEESENTNFEYYPDHQLKKTILTNKYGVTLKEYSKLENGFILLNQPDINLTLKYFVKFGRLNQTVSVINSLEEVQEKFLYKAQGNLNYRETSLYRTMYELNEKGDVSKKSSIKLINDKSITTTSYVFKYDKYGNWIAYASILNATNYSGIPSLPTVSLRQIEYSNGEVLGHSDPNDSKAKQVISELLGKLKESNNKTVYKYAWQKNQDGSSYWFYIDGKEIIANFKSYIGGKDLYVFNPDNKTIYKLKDFKTKSANIYQKAEKVKEIGRTSGLWMKDENQNFRVYNVEGNQFKITNKKWDANNYDFIVFGDREKGEQYVLKNYNDSGINELLEAKMYHSIANLPNSKTVSNTHGLSKTDYILSESERSTILNCEQDSKCLSKVFDDKYIELRKKMSDNELTTTFANYALALNNENPGQLFNVFMKSSYAVSSGILDVLPKEEMDKIREQSEELRNNYNKYINSKEVKEKVEKHGGKIGN